MTTERGYIVRAEWFVPADPNNMASMEKAHDCITDVRVAIEKAGGEPKITHKFISRRKSAVAQHAEERAAGKDEMPEIPTALRRA
jgi:hypothetical protein